MIRINHTKNATLTHLPGSSDVDITMVTRRRCIKMKEYSISIPEPQNSFELLDIGNTMVTITCDIKIK